MLYNFIYSVSSFINVKFSEYFRCIFSLCLSSWEGISMSALSSFTKNIVFPDSSASWSFSVSFVCASVSWDAWFAFSSSSASSSDFSLFLSFAPSSGSEFSSISSFRSGSDFPAFPSFVPWSERSGSIVVRSSGSSVPLDSCDEFSIRAECVCGVYCFSSSELMLSTSSLPCIAGTERVDWLKL